MEPEQQLVARPDPAGLGRRGVVLTRVGAAALAGQLGGVAFAVLLMIASALARHSPLWPLQVMGALFLGPAALERLTAGGVVLGLLASQLGPALFWALVFGALAASARVRLGLNDAMMLGFFLGGVAELVDVAGLMPPFQHWLHGADLWAGNIPRLWHWLAHAAYGLTLGGGFVLLRDQLERAWLGRRGARARP